ncbi:MAG: hypothetical protein J3Q66DRAFT_406102 [Benniella sp.]|nr:MAG: hypothetical protein J3Q66DRAFT_406102 [Benniella sp.]
MFQRLRRHAYWECMLEIDRILRRKDHPRVSSCGSGKHPGWKFVPEALATLLLSEKFGFHSSRAIKGSEDVAKLHSLEAHFSKTSRLDAIKRILLTIDDVPDADPTTFTLTRSSKLAMVQVQTALRGHYKNVFETVPSRSKYCRLCKVYLDRDVVESENIARICEVQLINRRRPAKFIPEAVAEAEGSRCKRRSEAEAGGPKQKRKCQTAAQGTKRKRQLEHDEFKPKC